MHLSKPASVLILLATLVPLAFMAFFLIMMFSFVLLNGDCDSPPLSDGGGDRIMVPVGGPKDERFTAGSATTLAAV
jgi:hypothetical protein